MTVTLKKKLKRLGKGINNIDVCEILYRESTIELQGTAFHNQHINFYSANDVSPAYLPSKQFVFRSWKPNTAFIIPHSKKKQFQRELPDSLILSTDTEDAWANSLLNTIRRIKPVTANKPLSDI